MAINYDAPSNTITVTGYSAVTPCNFTDIYNADVAGGWGKVTRQGGLQFHFDCNLQIGTAGTIGYFADVKKQIRFATNKILKLEASSYVKFGTLVNVSERLGKDGCHFMFDVTGWDYKGIDLIVGGSIEAYCCSFNNTRTGWNGLYYLTLDPTKTIRFWNCDFANVGFMAIDGTMANSTVFSETVFNNFQYGLCVAGDWDINTFETTLVQGHTYALFLDNINNLTLSNFTLKEISAQVFLMQICTGIFNFINFDCDWSFYWSDSWTAIANRQYTFNLKVTDKDGNNINGASVKIWDKDNTLVVDTTTSSGVITEQTITRGYNNQANGDTLQDASPHTIEIKKAGYQTYKKKFTMKKIDWTIRLIHTSINPDQEAF